MSFSIRLWNQQFWGNRRKHLSPSNIWSKISFVNKFGCKERTTLTKIYFLHSYFHFQKIKPTKTLNSSRENPRLKLTNKLMLLIQRDNRSPKYISWRKGTPKWCVQTYTCIENKLRTREAQKHGAPMDPKTGSVTREV